ncbi:hypothetical protein H8M03_03980 [Sphingomonas sabuli]|uniref:Uncharacterized protein n=1 Tax=Sphingomonas sabuli TaxID=2764186 RepID=A0A7G9L4F0_9SPHN|nr:hypothetical protein [Sphingomonas sabuli]QNM83499.1 hypothetical protein H8M03_03980 [Sphingomonas sabuli]
MRSLYLAVGSATLALGSVPSVAAAKTASSSPDPKTSTAVSTGRLLPFSYSLAGAEQNGGTYATTAPAAVAADTQAAPAANQWRVAQKEALKWEMGYLALSAIDLALTVQCLDDNECEEKNPIFGKHPKTSTLVAAKVGGSILHYLVFNHLNKRDPKTALRAAQISIGLQGAAIVVGRAF